jgi:predicted MFS family arabinose efflux permease
MVSRALVFTLAFASFTGLLSQVALVPLLPVVADDIGSTVPLLGQTITLSFLAGAVLVLFVGPVAEQYGNRRLMLVGAGFVLVSAVGTAVASGYWTVLLTRVPGGLGGGMMAALAVVLAGTQFPVEQRRWAIGWVVAGISVAPILGVPALAFIGEHFGWRMSFVAMGLLGLISGLALFRAAAPDTPSTDGRLQLRDVVAAYRPLLSHQIARLLQISNFLRGIGWGAGTTYLVAYLVTVHNLSLQQVGYITFVIGVCYLAGVRLGDGRYSSLSLRSSFALSTALMGIALGIVFAFRFDMWILAVPLLIGMVAGGAGFVSLTILISEESPGGPAVAMMLRQSGFSFGLAGGGALGGIAISLGGYGLLGAGVVGFAIASSLVLYRRDTGSETSLPEPTLAPAPVSPPQSQPVAHVEPEA